jgi:hypothetical protein
MVMMLRSSKGAPSAADSDEETDDEVDVDNRHTGLVYSNRE